MDWQGEVQVGVVDQMGWEDLLPLVIILGEDLMEDLVEIQVLDHQG